MIDGIEGFFRSLVYGKGSGEVLICHDCPSERIRLVELYPW
jgi:hypothetical protein